LGQFSTSHATQLYSRASVRQHFDLQHLWPVLISLENAPKLFCRHGDAFRAFIRSPGFSRRWSDSHRCRPRQCLAHSARRRPSSPRCLARYLEDLRCRIQIDHEVTQLPQTDLILADITPRQLLRIAGSQLPSQQLKRFRYGAGAFKIDYALSAPIPWTAPECLRAATVHIGASLEEIAESERTFSSDRPFVLLVNRRFSTRAEPQLASIPPGPPATYLTLGQKTVPNQSNARSHVSLRISAIAFWPDPFPHPQCLSGGTQIGLAGTCWGHYGYPTPPLPSHILLYRAHPAQSLSLRNIHSPWWRCPRNGRLSCRYHGACAFG